MKIFLFFVFLLFFMYDAQAQKDYVGPPNNIGREYGNPKMPLMVSHLAGANKQMLKRTNKNSRHSFFGKILCFRKLCRIQSGHTASLNAISYKKFKKKIARNAKKGEYKNLRIDSANTRKPVNPAVKPITKDTTSVVLPTTIPVVKADTLIVIGGELLFEVNRSTLLSEHFKTLNPIVYYLIQHQERSVQISGHTDNTGREGHNLTLSRQRSEVVAEYLVSNGIDSKRLVTSGLGSSKPIAENTTEAGRMKNRRVELLIYDE
jgi:outer membrane protein OmpA-like peptidoglycan-associated protein